MNEKKWTHRTDDQKRQIVSRIYEHCKTHDVKVACEMEGVNQAQYYGWRNKFGFAKSLFQEVTVLETKSPVEAPKPIQVELTVEQLVQKLKEKSKNCIIMVETENEAIIPVIKCDEKRYVFLHAIQGLKAIGQFQSDHPVTKPTTMFALEVSKQ